MHYSRFRRHGDPLWERCFEPKCCSIDGCEKEARARGWCWVHYYRWYRNGSDPLAGGRPDGWGGKRIINSAGYVMIYLDSGKYKMEHRVAMEEALNRPLVDHENVHHINGDRADNRLENLELWSTSQPCGQRIEDKVAWAKELLAQYEPSALACDRSMLG